MRARHGDKNYGKPLYVEVIRWSIWLWAFVLFMELSLLLAIWAALSNFATYISAAILILLTIIIYMKSILRITVTQGWLIVGPAAIERAFIHNFKILNTTEMKAARGVNASPLDYFQIRFWIPTGISMQLRDPRDRTSAWKISTRNCDELVKVLTNPAH